MEIALADTLNPKQEKFCQLVAKGEPVYRAYIMAGYVSKTKKDQEANGFRLYRIAQVTARIRELQLKNAAKIGVGVEQIVKELDSVMRLAKKTKQAGAAVAAITTKAKILGLMVDRQEVTQTVVRKPMRTSGAPERMTIEEWKKQFAPKLDLTTSAPANDDEGEA